MKITRLALGAKWESAPSGSVESVTDAPAKAVFAKHGGHKCGTQTGGALGEELATGLVKQSVVDELILKVHEFLPACTSRCRLSSALSPLALLAVACRPLGWLVR